MTMYVTAQDTTFVCYEYEASENSSLQTVTHERTHFEFQLQPGADEWAQLNNGERVLALQIPEAILKNMTTEELVEAVLGYPLFSNIIFFNSFHEGFRVYAEHFNGFQEILSREDAGRYLFDVYRNFNVESTMRMRDSKAQFETFLDLLFIETLLSQPEISKNMTDGEIAELLLLVDENFAFLSNYAEKLPILTTSAYYESLAIQQGIEPFNIHGTVRTPNGSNVPVIFRTGVDHAFNNRFAIADMIRRDFPEAVIVGDATIRYNCHAYVFARRTDFWMNDPSLYWRDGSCHVQAINAPTRIGQIIWYPGHGNEHSGRVVRLSGNTIRSKWSERSLVEHTIGNSPYFFIPLQVRFYGR